MKFTDVYLQTATKILVFIIMTFSIYVLFAGHNNPGGGFIGGLITASALVLLYIAFDLQTVQEVFPVDYKKLAATGVLVSVLTGVGSLVLGVPFLSQTFKYVELPFLGNTELTTAMIFDLGVYMCVVGTTMTIITSISEDDI
ncbi:MULTISPECIES: monovalent cation/H+ antiporter subunit B [Paenibacillus]|uniref:monovalent cation/H+ antiporter subunit B n=1 Tax=Paenibacillus TaxID=44249 RepID=UPI00203F5F2D|nr:monovalent cation/H+ antiporter subunit B [Paenibacillus camelliae]MCM3634191.1 monovalent cation/H+ antiporter subunit B [Paenibacillus camelliae]